MPKTKPHRFTIDRSKWLAGHLPGLGADFDSLLLNDRGQRCCVGFYAQSLGVTDRDMLNEETVWEGSDPGRKVPLVESGLRPLYNRNDSKRGTRLSREQAIAKLFRKHNVIVKFVGRYPR